MSSLPVQQPQNNPSVPKENPQIPPNNPTPSLPNSNFPERNKPKSSLVLWVIILILIIIGGGVGIFFVLNLPAATLSESDIESGKLLAVKKNQKIKLESRGQETNVKVKEINNNNVVIEIDKKSITLEINQGTEINLGGENVIIELREINDDIVNIKFEIAKECIEKWSCTKWSECVNNLRTRTCTDSNSCGTFVTQPIEEEVCASNSVQENNVTEENSVNQTNQTITNQTETNQTNVTVEGNVTENNSTNSTNNQTNQTETNQTSTTHNVTAISLDFSPSTLTIKAGDTVHWSGLSPGNHNVVETDSEGSCIEKEGGFNSGGPNTIPDWEYTFDTPGTYYYKCSPHCSQGMRGTIIVE